MSCDMRVMVVFTEPLTKLLTHCGVCMCVCVCVYFVWWCVCYRLVRVEEYRATEERALIHEKAAAR